MAKHEVIRFTWQDFLKGLSDIQLQQLATFLAWLDQNICIHCIHEEIAEHGSEILSELDRRTALRN